MSHYIVGSDRSGKSDNKCIEKVCQVLRDNGHTADNIGVTPNLEAQFRSKGKGCIGVFLVNGICIGTMDSVTQVVKSGLMDYWFIGITKSYYGGGLKLPDDLTTKKLKIAHDDNFTKEPRRSELNGNYTVAEFCQENSQYMGYAYGDDCEQVAQSILNGGSGGGAGTDSSSDDKNEPTPMSYLDMIKDLISVWDGDVECKIRQNKMYINKVPQPDPKLWVVESNNIVSGQAKVTDYNSDTVNTLNVDYDDGNHQITITDEYLINRFGEVSADVDAIKFVTDYSGDGTVDDTTGGNETSSGGGGASESPYAQISAILQKYYEKPSEGWNSITNKVRLSKTEAEIKGHITKLQKKKGQEMKSYVDVKHEIQKVLGITY